MLNAIDAPFRAGADRRSAAMVPSANRGLKSSVATLVDEPIEAGALAIVDFLTFTAQLSALQQGEFGARLRAAAVDGCDSSVELLCRYALHAIAPGSGLRVDEQVRGFRNFYDKHCRILTPEGKVCGFVALGGERQRGTFCVELTGEGCAHVVAWAHTREVLEGWGAKLSRVDCAHDDKEGRHTLADVQRWYDEGQFTSRGRPPAIGYQGFNDGSGQTIYVGKNEGNQRLCVYEKGKQLGDPSSPWVRFEARFGAKYREIPYDILERPWEFITGHYPPLSWISELSTRMQTSVAKAAACMAGSLRHAKRQCGRVVNALRKFCTTPGEFAGAVESLLKAEKLPAWAEGIYQGSALFDPVLRPARDLAARFVLPGDYNVPSSSITV
ncbi:replication initiation factor domain-containing protein [Luteibacter sp. Sphag1AF]|uniref:replication initiation factor domain-containing protein n=1 Tax=Luteibacter sp. Sphag1AF TaxID=2587031 RepID=UPI001618B4DD|nr:replication initiation factor domain-containing protein [Luteibacter sp. Sphag1AF]